MDTRVFRPSHRDKARQAGVRPVSQEPAARRLYDVPILNLRAPLRQHGERTGAYKARKVVSSEVWPCRRTVYYRQAVWLDRAVLRQEAG